MFSSTSRLECLGKSSKKQSAVEVTSARTETHKSNDTVTKKKVTDKQRRSLPARALPHSVQEAPMSRSSVRDVLNTEVCALKESINITPRIEERAELATVSGEELKMKAQPSAVTAGTTHASPPVEPFHMHEVNEKEEQTEEEDIEDEDLKAPVELIIEFLRAVMDRDFQLASRLCQMILIYEPDNPEASEFLPLIQRKLQEEQEADDSNVEEDEDDDDDDDSDDTGSDEESNESSSCSSASCSSFSPSDDDEEEDKRLNRHKLCPPSHISP